MFHDHHDYGRQQSGHFELRKIGTDWKYYGTISKWPHRFFLQISIYTGKNLWFHTYWLVCL